MSLQSFATTLFIAKNALFFRPKRKPRGLYYNFVGEASARLAKILGDRTVALMIDFFNVNQLSAWRSPEDTGRTPF